MKANYHFLVGRHSVDLFKIAIHQDRKTPSESNLILTSDSSKHAALYFGYSYGNDFPGLYGLLYHDPADLAVLIEDNAMEANAIFSTEDAGSHESLSELLDRVRQRLDVPYQVFVLSSFKNMVLASSCLTPEDKVSYFWEIRDTPLQSEIDSMSLVGKSINNSSCLFEGVQLYQRHTVEKSIPATTMERLRSIPSFGEEGQILKLK